VRERRQALGLQLEQLRVQQLEQRQRAQQLEQRQALVRQQVLGLREQRLLLFYRKRPMQQRR